MKKYKIITPTLTIFNDDYSIDYEGNKKLINYLLDNSVDGVVVLGSTGEFTGIDFEDKKKLVKSALDTVGNRSSVLVGSGCPTPNQTIELSNYAIESGAEGVLIICQYYYAMNDEEIYHYYDYLASKINGNIYLYNFPLRTNTSFTPELVLKLLRKHKNIVGMKESVNSFSHTLEIMKVVKEEFPNFLMYSGFDDQFLDNAEFDGAGSIGAISNLFPSLWSDWVRFRNCNDMENSLKIKSKIDKLMRLYQIETNCSGLFKHILKARGVDINTTTLFPFEYVSQKSVDEALDLIDKTI